MKHVAILLFFSTLLFACKKEQPALRSLEEDCGCAKEVSADFVMEESTYFNTSWEKLTETDTIFMNKNVQFRALENNAEYTWYLGSEVLHEQSFYRYFDQKPHNKRFHKTKKGSFKFWELERCLDDDSCPITTIPKANLKFLIGLRHEIEHQMTKSIFV